MRVLITGAGGYIGSVLTRQLLAKGYKVLALDRFFFGKDKLPSDTEGLEILQEDIRSFDPALLKDIDAVIDLAALSNDPSGEIEPIRTWAINHLGRFRVASLAKATGVRRYILPSSCSVYGFQDAVVDETSDTNPLTTYAKANLKAEEDILALKDDRFTVVILRQATVYGLSPRMRFDLAINGMVRGFFLKGKIPILRDGSQWRPFVHVRDTAKAISMSLEAPAEKVSGQIFNVGSDEQNCQIMELAKRIAQAIGIEFKYEWYGLPDHRSYRVSFQKIKRVLGFTPDYTPEEGAVEIWKALKEGRLDPEDPTTITVEWYKRLLEKGIQI